MSMSDDEIIEQRRAIVEACQDPENIHISINQIKDLGISAIATDGTFATVSRVFDKFVLDHKTQFPALSQFLTRWQGSHTTWKKILTESRDFATITSTEYRTYDRVYLDLVQNLETKDDLKQVIEALTHFSKNSNAQIPIDFANKFKDLGEEVKLFRDDFDKYLKEQGKELTPKVKELQELLAKAEKTVKDCDEVVRQVAVAVGFIPIIGYFAPALTQSILSVKILQRNQATAEAGRYKTEIEEANKAQEGLAKMQTDFAALDSEFQIVCGGLVIFAQTWQYFHAEAKKFADALEGINDVNDIPETFKSAVRVARAIAEPLEQGLEAYAQVIAES